MTRLYKNKEISTLLMLGSIFCRVTIGQDYGDNNKTRAGLDYQFIAENVADIRVTEKGTSWLILREDRNLSPTNFFARHGDSFEYGSNDAMRLVNTARSGTGATLQVGPCQAGSILPEWPRRTTPKP